MAQSPQDKKLFASTDINEQRALAKQLGISRDELMKAAYAVGGDSAARSVKDITDYVNKQKEQKQEEAK